MRAPHGLALALTTGLTCLVLAACGGGGDKNRSPVASAGPDQNANRNASVTLDGTGSTDADGNALAYRWTQTGGTPVSLSAATSSQPTFTAPAQSAVLTFQLVTNDGKVDSPADSVAITVKNRVPVAAAGADMPVESGEIAVADGAGSTDPDADALTYTWIQVSGTAVTIIDVAPGKVQFVAPPTATDVVLGLSVSDGESTSTQDTVTFHIVENAGNLRPVANAGQDTTMPRKSDVLVWGSGFDPNGSALTYFWEQVSGAPVTLVTPTAQYLRFTAPDTAGPLTFALRVNDGRLTSNADEVVVTIRNFEPSLSAVAISPGTAFTNDTLSLDFAAFDADSDTLTYAYEWQRNGATVAGQTSSTFPPSLTTKNDVITATVSANDGIDTTTAQATATILDSPAVLSASAPTAMNYGDTLTFTVTASDPDGDAIAGFEIDHGPAGFAVTSQGAVTWTASGPLFDRTTAFNWGVRVLGDVGSLLTGSVTVTDNARRQPLRRTGLQIPVQHAGLRIADLDNDGDSEVLVASSRTLYELSRSGSQYEQTWVHPFAFAVSEGFAAVTSADINGDGKHEIFAAQGTVMVRLDGVERRESARRDVQNERCRALEVADIDADGSLELVCLAAIDPIYFNGNARIVVLNPATFEKKWESADLPLGSSMAVGNVDGDVALEVVTAAGYVFDGQTHANQWAYSPGFGIAVDIGDLDGDGVGDIAGAIDGGPVKVFSAVSESPVWEYTLTWTDLDTLTVADSNSDGQPEIIVGNGQWGEVTSIRYNTGTSQPEVLWQINSQEHGVTSIAVGNLDGDAAPEIVWGTGATSSGADDMVVASVNPAIGIEWKMSASVQLDGPFYGGQLARTGGGTTALLFSSDRTNGNSGGYRPASLNAATGAVTPGTHAGANMAFARALDVADFNGNNVDEMLIGSTGGAGGFFATYEIGSDTETWRSPTGAGTPNAGTHADMNGDGYADVIGITQEGYIYVYDVHGQSLLWKSTSLVGVGVDVAVANIDGDSTPEIIAITTSRVVVYGKSGTTYLERATAAVNAGDLLVADTDGNGDVEIFVLGSGSSYPFTHVVTVFDGQLSLVRTVPLGTSATSLHLEGSGFGRKNLLVGLYSSTNPDSPERIWAVDPVTGAEVWRSPPLAGMVLPNSLHFVDANGDGKPEISFGTSGGMYLTR
jgi:hypothetical protein